MDYENPAWQKLPDQVMRPGGLSITEQTMSYCLPEPGERILDIGCGTGTALHFIAREYQCPGIGIDISLDLLKQAGKNKGGPSLICGDGEFLPFASQSMDIVMVECAVSAIGIDFLTMECDRILKTDGYLVFNDIYTRKEEGIRYLTELPEDSCIRGAYTKSYILRNLERNKLLLVTFQDCSEHLKDFPICGLGQPDETSSMDFLLAAAKAKLGYYYLVAKKVRRG